MLDVGTKFSTSKFMEFDYRTLGLRTLSDSRHPTTRLFELVGRLTLRMTHKNKIATIVYYDVVHIKNNEPTESEEEMGGTSVVQKAKR